MLAGLLTADEGDCEIAGEDSNRGLDYETRRHIGYLAQSFTLFGELTVDDNLNFLAVQVPPAEFEIKRHWVYELLSPAWGKTWSTRWKQVTSAVSLLRLPCSTSLKFFCSMDRLRPSIR